MAKDCFVYFEVLRLSYEMDITGFYGWMENEELVLFTYILNLS